MAKEFDDVENAIISTLETEKAGSNFSAKTIKSYAGEIDKVDDEKDIQKIIVEVKPLMPAALVGFSGSSFDTVTSGQTYKENVHFTIFVLAEYYGSNVRARTGSGNTVGTYQLLKELRPILVGKNLGLVEITPIEPVSRVPLLNTTRISVYGFIVSTWYAFKKV